MPVAETLHLAHVLTQAVKGLLTGANEGLEGKREHVFCSAEGPGKVRHWVARLEFQDGKRKRHVHRNGQFYHGRGAVHVHILLWLQDMQAMDLASKIQADVPGEDEPEMRDLVVGSQLDYTSSGWPLRAEPTDVIQEEQRLRLHHPREAFESKCRAYLPDVLAALRCHVDVLASDGRAMVLKYCASYLPKFSSSFAAELLNSEATDFSLARRVLADYHPLQPEMILQLAAQQHPQFVCPANVRKFVVPVPWQKELPQIVQSYMASTWRRDNMSLLDFLRKSGASGQISQKYRRMHSVRKIGMPLKDWINVHPPDGQTLVASVMYAHTNDRHYGQWLLLNVPFRDIDDLWHPQANLLPENLRYLGLCVLHRRRFWRNQIRIRAELEKEARNDLYIQNTLAMLTARIELIDAYLSGDMTVEGEAAPPLDGVARVAHAEVRVAPEQAAVINVIGRRVQHAVVTRWPEDREVEGWAAWLEQDVAANRATVILGPAGSGKSTAVEIALDRAVQAGAHVGVACPTGMLATRYRARHPDLDIDTVHGMFALHKEELATADMMKIYDMLVIDEVGQLPEWIFERLLRLWDAADRRTALVFVGDFCQLLGPDGTTARDSIRWQDMHILYLHEMRRCKCEKLKWKLQLLRSTQPSGTQLKKILRGHRANLRSRSGVRNDLCPEDIAAILQETPQTTFVTITRRGSARLNQLAMRALFADAEILDRIPCDPQENFENFRGTAQVAAEPFWLPIHEGMRVVITRNTDKENGFVNGMGATVQRMRRSGVQVKTDAGKVLLIHPIAHECQLWDGSNIRTTAFPLRLGYSTTLHKIQGATLKHVTLWMDVPFVRAALYVALSRVQYDRDWRFVGSIDRRHCLPAKPTDVIQEEQRLRLHHPREAFESKCRAYLPDVLAALRCHVDVLASDGRAMVLKYCASYLPKFSSSFAAELLNSEATDFSLARRVLADYHPLQPEMILQLAAQQHPQFVCPANVRKFVVPVPWQKELPQIVQSYMASTWRRDNMSLLDFLRKSGASGQISQKYRRMHSVRKIGMPLKDWINVHPPDGQTLVASVMYAHTNDRHYGQWLLLNVPFRDIDDLWHPQANLLPENLRYLGLCVLHRRRFWRNQIRIRAELEKEARNDLYIQNTLAMLTARIELIDAYLSGDMTVEGEAAPPLDGVARVAHAEVRVAPEQAAVINVIGRRVQHAVVTRWPEDREVEGWAAWLEQDVAANRATVILGPAGSGKSTAVEIALDRAVQAGAHVGVACPTGMLATRYRARHPDLDIDTVHGMFALHKEELATADMMKIYDMLVIDEVGQLPEWIFERLLRLWDAADRRTALVFVGDFCQLLGPDGTTARDSIRWQDMHILYLHEMRRCKCEKLKWKLQLLRSTQPSGTQLKKILRGHRANLRSRSGVRNDLCPEDIAAILQETPQTTFVTITRRGSARLNQLAMRALFADAEILDRIPCDPQENFENFRGTAQVAAEPFWLPIHEGMRVVITRNTDKENGFVNGMGATVQRMRRSGVQVKTDAGKVLLIHPIAHECQLWDGSNIRTTAFPLRLGYSTTLHKIQGATLKHVTLWMDVPFVRAALYVALSRVQYDRDWRFVGSIDRRHCLPASL
ncbi:pif1 [Symbiodinium sp. CCMP2592]|nr:pif1 [Symbiodinium sp. CCMP2592]